MTPTTTFRVIHMGDNQTDEKAKKSEGIESRVFDRGLPVNTLAMAERLKELLKENDTNCLEHAKSDPRIRQLLWLINQQFYGSLATVDLGKEWDEMYAASPQAEKDRLECEKGRKLTETIRQKYPETANFQIGDKEHFLKAAECAEKLGGEPLETFKRALTSLYRWTVNDQSETKGRVRLTPDFVPHSFGFVISNLKGEFVLNGGVICHGLKGVETFSVELVDKSDIHWSVHT